MKSNEFERLELSKQIDFIKVESFNLMIGCLTGRSEIDDFLAEVDSLSRLKILSKLKIYDFLNSVLKYEAYQVKIGKDEAERNLIHTRMLRMSDMLATNN